MSTTEENLWPRDIDLQTPLRTPLAVLREQGNNLAQLTNGLVVAAITPFSDPYSHYKLGYLFGMVVPSLDNYQYDLLRIEHGPALYPLRVTSSVLGGQGATCQNEEELLEVLRQIFNSPEARRVLQSLVAHARDSTEQYQG